MALSTIKVIDPFSGDGRLVFWLIKEVSLQFPDSNRTWKIDLWDCDAEALQIAQRDLRKLFDENNISGEVNIQHTDSFELATDHFQQYDLCITNPPWEILKPDSRETDGLSEAELKTYVGFLKSKDKFLFETYSISAPRKRFSGWGLNLARCGVECAIRLTNAEGVCAVVSPSTLLADQQSSELRQWIFRKNSVIDVAHFAAEARLFDGVDQPCITLTVSPGSISKSAPTINIYGKDLSKESIKLTHDDWEQIAKDKYTIPLQFGISLLQLNKKWNSLPKFADLEAHNLIWAGRELDETRYEDYLTEQGEYLFIKGRMVKRYGLIEKPTRYVKTTGPKIPKTANYPRIVWRDVARPTQKRRIQATLIPAGYVSGNSLNVTIYKSDNEEKLKALLGIMNSFIFEAQVRMFAATAHVSLGAIRQAKLPSLNDKNEVNLLSKLVDKCLSDGSDDDLTELEITIAKLYGLNKEEFSLLLSSFDKLTLEEKSLLLSDKYWKSKTAHSQNDTCMSDLPS